MSLSIGVVMDPIHTIHFHKDSTMAMLWAAKARSHRLYYFELSDLFLKDGIAYGIGTQLEVFQDESRWFSFQAKEQIPLAQLDIILMRKDPPVDAEYLYATHILEHAEFSGTIVSNPPKALREVNEKLLTQYFTSLIPPTLVARSPELIKKFCIEYEDVVLKPLNVMGGQSIFRLQKNDVNRNAVIDLITHGGKSNVMVQQYIPAIKMGDKRILMLHGEPISHGLMRVPGANDWRGNLAMGAKGVVQALNDRDFEIARLIKQVLLQHGLWFAGLDVIGNYLTEINVTSPTGIQEIERAANVSIADDWIQLLESKCKG